MPLVRSSPSQPVPRGRTPRPRAAGAVVAALALAVALGACTVPGGGARSASTASTSGPSTTTATPSPSTTTTPPPPPVQLTPSVASGAQVPVDTVVSVAASDGTVADVELTYKDPKKGDVNVEGKLDPNGANWTAASLLEPATTYSLTMSGKNTAGVEATTHSTFSTQALSKKQLIYPSVVANGATVGVAMPVIVRFDVPVKDKAGFEKRMTVTSTPKQDGSWGWVSSSEAHWRPVSYWQPGTKVSVNVDINSVAGGDGTYGQISTSGGFTVGQSVVMNADLATHQMTVMVDGAAAKTIPITGGKAGFESRSGTKVIMEKFSTLRMDANTVGIEPGDPNYYDIPDVQFAMRETNSGEFLHAAPWSVSSQGKANVSHGCIGMSTDNAKWLFGIAKVGDPVVVTGTARGLEAGNGWTDWNVSYDKWKSGSALSAA
ncbi:MAG: Ig-like domain-containing protein [Lapillicoccus sp.]